MKCKALSWLPFGALIATCLLAACIAPVTLPAGQTPMPTDLPSLEPSATESVPAYLAKRLQIDPATVETVAAEAVEWSNSCLDLPSPDEMCAQAQLPGYKLTLRANDAQYVFHTDALGYQIRVASAPTPAIGDPIITWQGQAADGRCLEATIGLGGIAGGWCGLPPIGSVFVSPARQATLVDWVANYAAFDAETAYGQINFAGQGANSASADEQQTLAQWAETVSMEAAAGASMASLVYQGPQEFGRDDTSKCVGLNLSGDQHAALVACDNSVQTIDIGKRFALDWFDIQNRFAAFVYETPTETLIFNGMGSVRGEAWQRAILAWVRTAHAELASARVSASGRTVLSWQVEQPYPLENVCPHLTVLAYGYAYAEIRACDTTEIVETIGGWLTSEEMVQLDAWLYTRAALYQDDNYIDGQGTEPMSEDEIISATNWAANLWARVQATPPAVQPTAIPAGCPIAGHTTRLLINSAHGYCLLYPDSYVPLPAAEGSSTEIVKGQMMNHVDPRVSIHVEDAAGRTLAEVADQLDADFALPGIAVERSSITIDGVEAIVLDNLPGQDLNRRIVLLHNARLYSFFLTPLGETEAARAAAEAFFQGVLGSLRFFDATSASPLPLPAAAAVVTTTVPLVQALVDLHIYSGPGENYGIIGQIFGGQSAMVTGVMPDGAWWRVICPDDTVGSCFVSADPTLTTPAEQ